MLSCNIQQIRCFISCFFSDVNRLSKLQAIRQIIPIVMLRYHDSRLACFASITLPVKKCSIGVPIDFGSFKYKNKKWKSLNVIAALISCSGINHRWPSYPN